MLERRRQPIHDPPMKLNGDPQGIAALKALHERDPNSVKFLVQDATTTTDMATTFRDEDGIKWRLAVDPKTRELIIERYEGPPSSFPRPHR
jgi:hypothetical protein